MTTKIKLIISSISILTIVIIISVAIPLKEITYEVEEQHEENMRHATSLLESRTGYDRGCPKVS